MGAIEWPPRRRVGTKRQQRIKYTQEVEKVSVCLQIHIFSSLFRRTRWTPAPGHSRNDTVPVDSMQAHKHHRLLTMCSWYDFYCLLWHLTLDFLCKHFISCQLQVTWLVFFVFLFSNILLSLPKIFIIFLLKNKLNHVTLSSLQLTGVSTILGLLFLRVFTAWNTSTTLCLLAISNTMLLAQKTPLRPPPFLLTQR